MVKEFWHIGSINMISRLLYRDLRSRESKKDKIKKRRIIGIKSKSQVNQESLSDEKHGGMGIVHWKRRRNGLRSMKKT